MREVRDQTIVLMNDTALGLPAAMARLPEDARIFVAGRSIVRMNLAELALPGSETVWTDFRQTASLGALHATLQAAGGIDRLIFAADGADTDGMLAVMRAVVTVLPALRRRPGAAIWLCIDEGPALATLQDFVRHITPGLTRDRIGVAIHPVPPHRSAMG